MSMDNAILKSLSYTFGHGEVWHYVDRDSNDVLCKYNRVLVFIKNFFLSLTFPSRIFFFQFRVLKIWKEGTC